MCNAGYVDCDGNPSNGCEADLSIDSSNCGACGHACPTGTSCNASACNFCPTGRVSGFAAQATYPVGSSPYSVAVGDFNGDGKPDLAVAENNGTVDVLLNQGNGTFAFQVSYPVGSYPSSVAVGDFNGDGKPDLAVANQGGNTISVLLNVCQ